MSEKGKNASAPENKELLNELSKKFKGLFEYDDNDKNDNRHGSLFHKSDEGNDKTNETNT